MQMPICQALLDDVVRTLEKGQIPVVTLRNSCSGLSLELDVLAITCSDAAKPTTPYIAISHVWADGLGSTTETGLPSCQLRRLASLVKQLNPSGAFWMDALCVPELKSARKQAIVLMAKTYSYAKAVLVIDSGIQSCSLTSPLQKQLVRVLTSAWMQRLWTVQEAVLAHKLYFAFSDGLATIDELKPDRRMDVLNHQLASNMSKLSERSLYIRLDPSKFGLQNVLHYLQWRTTSKPEDETLAISSLVGVNTSELVGIAPEKRMSTLLLKIRNLPPTIIFEAGPKLREPPNFKWALQTFMNLEGHTGHGGDPGSTVYSAVCTEEGLISAYPYLYFDPFSFKEEQLWYFDSKFDQGRRHLYRVWAHNHCMGDDEPVEGYTYNGVLFQNLPRFFGEMTLGIAVFMHHEPLAEGVESRVTCDYVSTVGMFLFETTPLDGIVVDARGGEKLNVCIR